MGAITEKTFKFLNRYKYVIVAFWLIPAIISAFFALGLLDVTIWILNPPKGYPSYVAYNKMNEYFPDLLNADAEIIVIELKKNSYMENIDNNMTESLCNDINQSIYNLNNDIVSTLQYYYAYKNHNISTAILNKVIKPEFIDSSGNMMIFIITLNVVGVSTKRVNSFLDDTKSILTDLTSANITYSTNYQLELTGMMTLIEDCIQVLSADIISKDLMLLPVIFIFMIFVVGSYKLILLPFLCFGMVSCISFALFRIVAANNWMTVPPENPSFMLFISMAICVDYGMFLLTRFISAIQTKHLTTTEAIKDMLEFSGHVIVLSGSILILLEIGFGLFFPDGGLNAAGYGIALCVFLSITISISFTTALILIFPNFFSDIEKVPKSLKFLCCQHPIQIQRKINSKRRELESRKHDVNSSKVSSMFSINSPGNSIRDSMLADLKEEPEKKENIYFKLAQLVTRQPYKFLFPVLIYLSMGYVLYCLFSGWSTTMSPNMMFPTNTDSVDAYNKLVNNFNPGLMQPFYVLALPKNQKKKSIWNQTYFTDICQFGNALIDIGYTNNSDMMSFVFMPDPLNAQKIKCFRESRVHQMVNNPNGNALYLELFNMTVNKEQTASLIILYPTFNPFGSNAQKNSDSWRDFITSYSDSSHSMDLYVHSEVFWQIDLLQMEYDRLPLCLVIMLSLIFIIIGLTFKSILLPSQLLLCIVIPIMFVYGCCVGVYNYGWLDWTNINGYKGLYESNGLFWPTPILSLSLLLGLALDYEIFLLSRVYEYRSKHCYTCRASIILALASTGPVISSAGIVMALAFCGLLLETVPSCDQFGFIFVVGVLVDTFIIRPILVPSILSFADYWNWYPTIMPSKDLKNEYHQHVDHVQIQN